MKLLFAYFLPGLFIVLGLLALILKPFYEPDKRINLRKASIYQGLAMLILGFFLLIQDITLTFLGFSNWKPLGIFAGVIAFVIMIFRLEKACYIKDESENLTFSIGSQQRKAVIFKRCALIVAFGFIVFLFVSWFIRPKIEIVGNNFKVGGEFGFEYPIGDIVQVDTLQGYPGVVWNQGGGTFAGISKGSFTFQGKYRRGRLFLKNGIRPYIFMQFKNNDVIFFNLKTSGLTIDFYKELKTRIKKN